MKKLIRPVLVGFLAWTAYTFLSAGILAIQQKIPYVNAWMTSAIEYYIMALLSVPLWFFCRRFSFQKTNILLFFTIHLIIGAIFSAVWLVISYFVFAQLIGDFLVEILLEQRVHFWQYLDGITKYGLLIGIFYTIHFYRKFKEKELRETELSLLTKNMELQNLKSQINPHFLFNTLNSVNALMAKDPEKARTMNAKLAELLRFSLDGYDRRFVTLKQELEFVHNYLDIEKVRFADKLKITEDIDRTLLDKPVPSMLLQPLVENAIKHGISNQTSGGELRISGELNDGMIHLRIENSGESVADASIAAMFDRGIGLKNTRKRLHRIYGDECKFEITAREPNGLVVAIAIPEAPQSEILNSENSGAD